jgi:hypothetical protein
MENLVESFTVFAGSGKGLTARPIGPDDVEATADNLASVTFESFDEVTGLLVASGIIAIAAVMLADYVPWSKDLIGYSFRWPAPGTLWPAAGGRYRVQVTFTPSDLTVPPYLLAWQANTRKVF